MRWLRRRRLRHRLAEIRPLDLDAAFGPLETDADINRRLAETPLVCRHEHPESGNAGHHWNSPTAIVPNLPSGLLTRGGAWRADGGRWPDDQRDERRGER